MTLALAVGATTAIFAVVDAVLIDPLAYPESDRLVVIRGSAPGSEVPGEFGVGLEFYVAYRNGADLIEGLGLLGGGQTTVRSHDRVDRLFFVNATASLYTTLGVQPMLGQLPPSRTIRITGSSGSSATPCGRRGSPPTLASSGGRSR